MDLPNYSDYAPRVTYLMLDRYNCRPRHGRQTLRFLTQIPVQHVYRLNDCINRRNSK